MAHRPNLRHGTLSFSPCLNPPPPPHTPTHPPAGPVLPLKDPTSDMAVIARSGSRLVREVREKKDANKSRWGLSGVLGFRV